MNGVNDKSKTNLSRTSMTPRRSADPDQQQRSPPSQKRMTIAMLLQPQSNHSHPEDGNLCLRLQHVSSTVSDRALDEDLKRALEKNCNIESPTKKKQKKKESWAFCEPAKIIMPPLLTIGSSTSMVISCLGGLTEDNRPAKIANMLREATEMAEAVGKLDPEPESRPNGRRRFHRRNSFVIHRNRKSTGIIQ
jgi:hypothetical protein